MSRRKSKRFSKAQRVIEASLEISAEHARILLEVAELRRSLGHDPSDIEHNTVTLTDGLQLVRHGLTSDGAR